MDSSRADFYKERLTDVYIYVMLLVFPLFTGFWGYTRLTASKLGFFLILTVFWLLGLIILSLKRRNADRPRPSAVSICLLIYLSACCLSALFSPYKSSVFLGGGRFDGFALILLSVGIFFGVSRCARPKLGYLYALAISMCLCCTVALLQLLGFNPLWLFPNGYTYYSKGVEYTGEFLGTIGNANLFSAFLCLCLPLISGVFICMKKFRGFLLPALALGAFCMFECTVSAGKLTLAACFLVGSPLLVSNTIRLRRWLLVIAAFFTALSVSACFGGERTGAGSTLYFIFGTKALILFSIAALSAVLAFALKRAKFSRRGLFISLSVASAAAAASSLAFIYNIGGEQGTLYEMSQVLHGNLQDSFGSSRIMIWRDCLSLFSERPLLGGGPGTAALRLDIDFSRFVAETGKTLTARVDNAHNVYLGILVDTGILALLPYLAAIVLSLIKAKRGGISSPLIFSFGLGLLCYWMQDFFGLGLFIVSPIMWILWGLVASPPKSVDIRKE